MLKALFLLMLCSCTAYGNEIGTPYHRDAEFNIAGRFSICEPEVISSFYGRDGTFYEVVQIIDEDDARPQVVQIKYVPVGPVPVGTGDETYK